MQQLIHINRENWSLYKDDDSPNMSLFYFYDYVMSYVLSIWKFCKKIMCDRWWKRLYFPVVCCYLNCNWQEWVPALIWYLYCVGTTQNVMNILLLKSQVYFDFRTKTYSSHAERDVWLSCFDDTWERATFNVILIN